MGVRQGHSPARSEDMMTHRMRWDAAVTCSLAVSAAMLLCGPARSMPQSAAPQTTDVTAPAAKSANPQTPPSQQGNQPSDQQNLGTISGTIVDQSGAIVVGAQVKLTRGDQTPPQEVQTDEDGQFTFASVAPGPFELTCALSDFTAKTYSGTLIPGEYLVTPQMVLTLAEAITEVRVAPSQVEVAEEQLKDQEKQRVLGFVPNFYVSYLPNPAPLNTRQKFQLAWKSTIDPATFGITAATAGIEQGQNHFAGYGPGIAGYGKRFGATYGDLVSGTFIGGAILPSILKQDPRYFYKGTGTFRARLMYALAQSVICKGDNGRWQPNYSNMIGSLAAGGISNLYYPPGDRSGAGLTFETALIGIGATAAANVLQEFVVRKFTPNTPHPEEENSKSSTFGKLLLNSIVHEGA
jgi:hypothetical protein